MTFSYFWRACTGAAVLLLTLCNADTLRAERSESSIQFDTVISNGRVMDPETGFDDIAFVGIIDGQIRAVSADELQGKWNIDATGLVVAPGFIDLHAHGQNPVAQDLQAQDGVTTALEQELGVYPVAPFYAQREGRSRINFGASVSHQGLRLKVKTGADMGHPITDRLRTGGFLDQKEIWAEAPLTKQELTQSLALLRDEIAAGGLGLGLAHEYTPGADRIEVYSFFKEAAALQVPVFVHVRRANQPGKGGLLEMMQEVIADAAIHGASLHICHVPSKGLGDTAVILDAIENAQKNGLDITTEAYPYTAGSTGIGTALFNEGWQERWSAGYEDVEWPSTGERLNAKTFAKYRREYPGAAVVFHMIPEEAMLLAIPHPLVMIASDGGSFEGGSGHPRGAGTFSRVLGRFVREQQALPLMDALRKMTLMPAQKMEQVAPVMKKKGRLQVGMDADITVFDPATVNDRATYRNSMEPSAGIMHVLVAGVPIISNGTLDKNVFPGQGILGERPKSGTVSD